MYFFCIQIMDTEDMVCVYLISGNQGDKERDFHHVTHIITGDNAIKMYSRKLLPIVVGEVFVLAI